jgi:tetratricopeptide (TPR) repeat protein
MTAASPTADLDEAARLHREGKLAEAAAAYQRILSAKPHALAAVHGLAVITLELGEPKRAMPLLGRLLATQPQNGAYRATLGYALLELGDNEQAAAHLLDAVNLEPRVLEPWLYMARALTRLGRAGQAADVLTACAQIFPDDVRVWTAKGNAERASLLLTNAELSLHRALELTPADPDLLNNLGVVLRAQGRTERAIGFYRQALALAPTHALTHANLGNALAALGQNVAAEQHLREALALDPASDEVRVNLAGLLTQLERGHEAIPLFREVLLKAPENADALTNLGIALLNEGALDEAETHLRAAIVAQPQNAEAHYNLAWLLLLSGRWAEGWAEYEWRWKLPNFSSRRRAFKEPLWDGGAVNTLLLHAEQGLGDAIQFGRYAARAKEKAQRVIVEVPRPLVSLFRALPDIDVVATGDPLPRCDAQAPFMSLPRIFASRPENVPPPAPFTASPSFHLDKATRPRVGLVWAGSPDNKIDRRRKIPTAAFAALLENTDADFVSLQVGPRAEEIDQLPQEKIVYACDGVVGDFADTAAVIAQLDLVIGVDTAVMHLAASLGKPTWMLVPFMPDYRWLLGRDDSPWYPALRLFRQGKGEAWPDVVTRLAGSLTNWQR